ncbi:hypothetical protein C8J57DRAFT_1228520 [Mycena rebaudengoi]|nr:hypothetical protein C8J57DRAFT_1228520 [Mycena rebaudengoi]
MMISPSLVSRDNVDLSKPFGPVFWGVILNLIAFGMSLIQALSYCRTAGKDRLIIKLSALAMILFDMVSTFLIIAVFWTDLVRLQLDKEDFWLIVSHRLLILVEPTNSSAPVPLLAQNALFLRSSLFCNPSPLRSAILSSFMYTGLRFISSSKSTMLTVSSETVRAAGKYYSLHHLFGIACAAVMLMNPMTPHYNINFQVVFGGSKGANALCDILATIMMCKYLSDSKTGIKSTENLLDTLTKIFMHRGALVMLIQVFTFIMFFAFQNPQYWLAPHLLLTKVYVNTFFAILNSRTYLREKHFGTSNMSSFRVHTGSGSDTKASAPMSFATNTGSAVITKEISVESDHGYSTLLNSSIFAYDLTRASFQTKEITYKFALGMVWERPPTVEFVEPWWVEPEALRYFSINTLTEPIAFYHKTFNLRVTGVHRNNLGPECDLNRAAVYVNLEPVHDAIFALEAKCFYCGDIAVREWSCVAIISQLKYTIYWKLNRTKGRRARARQAQSHGHQISRTSHEIPGSRLDMYSTLEDADNRGKILRLAFLRSQAAPVRNSKLGYALLVPKGVAALFVVATTIASLVYSHRGHVLIAAPIVQILSALLLVILVIAEHFKSVTPSTLIIIYAFCKGVFTAAIMRSSLMIGDSRLTTLALQLATAAYFLLSLTELLGKRCALVNTTVPRVSSSSFISRAFYVWLIPLLWSGRKKTLTIADCGAIPHEMGANASTEPLHALLAAKANIILFFLSPIIPRILLLVALFMQPLLAARMIEFISHPEQPSDRGWALAGGFVCTYALIFLMTSIYWEKVFDCTVLYRGALVGNIYRKTLRLSSASGREVGGGVASTYMSVDVERVCLGLETFHELWAAIISIILAVALLYSQATWPAFFPLVITVFMIVIAGYVSKGIGAAHGAWMGSTDKRIKFLSSIINNYLPMKLSHYENRGQQCTLSVLGPYAALAAHDHHRGVLDPERIFTIVATINLMSPPLILACSMPQLRAAYASLKRIEKYLSLEERNDLLLRSHENEHIMPSTEKGREASEDIRIEGASFSWAADKPAFLGPLSLVLTPGHLHLCTGPVASPFMGISIPGQNNIPAVHTRRDCMHSRTFCASKNLYRICLTRPTHRFGYHRDNIVFGQVFVEQWYNVVLEACALEAEIDRMNAKDGTFLGEKGATLSGGQRQRISLARAIYAKAPWTFLDDPFSSLDAETEKHVFNALFGSNGLLRNKGVVLVTNNANHLNHADRIIVLNAGAMQYEGTLDEIRAAGYQFDHYARKEDPKESETSDKPEAVAPAKKHVAEKERAEAPIPESSLGLTPYLFYLRMAGWSGSMVVLVFFVIAGLVRLALQIYLQQWSESNGRHPGIWVGGYSALTVGNMLAIAVGMWVFTIVITGPVGASRIINRFSQVFFFSRIVIVRAETNTGHLHKHLRCYLALGNHRRVIFWHDPEHEFSSNVILVGSLVLILVPTPWLTLAVPFLGAFYWIILSFYLKTAKQFQQLGAASKSPLYTQFSTTLVGLVTISLGLALANLTSMSGQLSGLLMSLSGLENASVAVSRIHEIASLPKENDPAEVSDEKKVSEKTPPSDSTPHGAVTFRNVRLRYQDDLDLAIDDISFEAPAGYKIGICGRTGSGKSSLIMALFRAVDPSLMSGQVLIDGIDTQTIRLGELRDSLSLVAQSPFIWNAPLRYNLDPHGEYTDAQIWVALERIGLNSAVSDLPDKLETMMDDGGSLSAGQRQLLCLARILLRRRKIVVLDEASSSLDADTDTRIREIVRTDLSDSTVIAVAHRIQTILDFDLVLILDKGKLVESGSPEELLSRSDSRFRKLASSQGIADP